MRLFKGTKAYSILTGFCPVCQEETMYINKNAYSSKIISMHNRCRHCNLKYELEPSFFYGAMYVSYAVAIAFAVVIFLISKFVFGASLKLIFIAISSSVILLMPIIARLSRNIWINVFKHYDPSWKNKTKK